MLMDNCIIILGAIFIDLVLGWPKIIFKLVGHPVTWMGNLINLLDIVLNQNFFSNNLKKLGGLITLTLCILTVMICIILLEEIFYYTSFGLILSIIVAWPFLAINSMHKHIRKIFIDLQDSDLNLARKSVSKIVGRDTKKLNKVNLIRSSLESLSENTSDGIVAPIFWGLLFGLPGLAVYKMINTLDSMIGYKNEKYIHFGWASAKMDDFVNIIPSRITGFLYAIVSGNFLFTISIMIDNARKHDSPNAGYPEAALAGALNAKLYGPRTYEGVKMNSPWINKKGLDPSLEHLTRAIKLYERSIILIIFFITSFLIIKLSIK